MTTPSPKDLPRSETESLKTEFNWLLGGLAAFLVALVYWGGSQTFNVNSTLLVYGPTLSLMLVAYGCMAWSQRIQRQRQRHAQDLTPVAEAREERIRRLVRLLTEANTTLAELENDITEGHRLAAEIETKVNEQQALAEMTADQQAVVAEMVRTELSAELKMRDRFQLNRDIIIQVVIAAFFLWVGYLIGGSGE